MRRYAVIGHPIAHSLSPVIHAALAAHAGIEIQYEQIDASEEAFEAAVAEFWAAGGCGLNVTVPHKHKALQLATRVTPRAQAAGAVNWLVKEDDGLLGDNTDGAGLVRDLKGSLRLDLAQLRILILGAGGAARGIIHPLLEAHPTSVTVANRTPERAAALVQSIASPSVSACALDDLGDSSFDLILNATASALSEEPLKLPASLLASARTVCYDLMYGEETDFQKWARAAGCQEVHDGFGMLLEQAAESFSLWHDVTVNIAAVRRELMASSQAP